VIKIDSNAAKQNKSLTIEEDFELLKIVGKGSFGKVIQVKYVFSLS
jgi:hypothetical protein